MNIKNKEDQQCYRCKKPTMTWYPKENNLKCASCNFEFNFEKNKSKFVNYKKLFEENRCMWIFYIFENLLKSHKSTKMYENIPMNTFSMELITKVKEFHKEILKMNYEETKSEEVLKDFKLFFREKSNKIVGAEFYEFTSVHHAIIDTSKNAWSLVNAKWDKIQKMKIKDNNLSNNDFNLVVDYLIEPWSNLINKTSSLTTFFNPIGKPKEVKRDLVLEAKKFLYWNTKINGDLNKKWDFEFWNTGFNDILLVEWNINPLDNSLTGKIWFLRKYVDNEEHPIFEYTFKKDEVESIFARIGIESFSNFISSTHKKNSSNHR